MMCPALRFLLSAMLMLVGSAGFVRAGPWEDANAAYAGGAYAKALPLYQTVMQQEGPSAARLFNLGNTHARLNQTGLAVLCYERAALLAPRDEDIQTNLRLTRPATAVPSPAAPPLWKAPLYWLGLHEWSWLALLGVILLLAAIVPWAVLPSRRGWHRQPFVALMGSGLALIVTGSLAFLERGGERHFAILTAEAPILRLSPFADANPVTGLPPVPGQRVVPGERHADWLHVSLPGNNGSGWVPDKDLALIIPSS